MRRSKRRSSKTRNQGRARGVAVEVVELEVLSESEESERLHLERKVEQAFYEAGKALASLRERRLYRSTHINFESYCRDRFQFTRNSAYQKIAAAEVYQNLEENLPTIGRQHNDVIALPTNERQLRPIVKARLEPIEQVEVWQLAVEEAGGKLPSGRIVFDIVQRIREKNPVPNPFRVGEVCQIIVKDNPELRGKGGCWCIVSSVAHFSCTINTFDREYHLRPEYLKSLDFSKSERDFMVELGVRMSELYETGELEEVALGILNKLAKIERAYLTKLEEELLSVLERRYKLR
jgi:hypothetical protein